MSDATAKTRLFTTPSAMPPSDVLRRLFYLPLDAEWLGLFGGAVSMLFDAANWQERDGGVSIEDTIQVFLEAWVGKMDNFMLGSIVPITNEVLPDYMLICDGANYSGDDYPALYAVIDPIFKLGDGTFVVPNLQGRFILGELPADIIEGREFPLADIGGEYEHVLTVDELAIHNHVTEDHNHIQDAHNHTQDAHNHTQDAHGHSVNSVPSSTAGTATALMRGSATLGNTTVNNTTATNQATTATNQATTATNQATNVTVHVEGDDEPHNNIPPYFVLKYAMIAR